MSIEKLSLELKSSSSDQRQGLANEIAALNLLKQNHHQILFHRFRSFYAEVDIISLAPDGVVHLLEVKSSEPLYFYEGRQWKRLSRLQDRLLEHDLDVELSICYPKAGKLGIYQLRP